MALVGLEARLGEKKNLYKGSLVSLRVKHGLTDSDQYRVLHISSDFDRLLS
jgi:hypothetical protein